jgi:phage-related protein
MTLTQVRWVGDSHEQISAFPDDPRREAGYQLGRVQAGKEPADWKPMPSIGLGVNEIRVREDSGAYRVIYVAKFVEAVYVLHAFQKKAQQTAKHDIDLARRRFRELLQVRRRR